jgi:4-hydroxybenzoate polyprenyltransferase
MAAMDDGGRRPERDASAATGVPLLVSEEIAGGGAGLVVVALFAYLRASLPRLGRVAAWVLSWLLGGREGLERKLEAAGAGAHLAPSPRLAAIVERAVADARPVYLMSRRCSPLLQAFAAGQSGIAGVVVVPDGMDSAAARFPQGYDAAVGGRGAPRIVRYGPAGALKSVPDDIGSPGEEGVRRVSVLRELVASLRPHQWIKNILVFVPLVLSGRFTVPAEVADTLLAFAALTCVACGTYILNDIWDVTDDRAHWSKKERPIASGRLSAATALGAAAVLIPTGLALGALVSWTSAAFLLAYLALTLAYSLRVKTVPFLDGFALAALFTIRLGLGVAAADAPPSPWLFVFSMFLFSSLSYAKRYTEIGRAVARNACAPAGRGYLPADAPMVLTAGLAAGVGAVMIMVLYIVEEAFRSSFYGSTGWLWGFPPLVFLLVIRIWLVSVRGEMLDDPVAFAIRDRACIGLLALLLVCFAAAWLA